MPAPSFNLKAGIPLFLGAFVLSAVLLYGGAQLVDSDDPAAASEEEEVGGVPGGPATLRLVARNNQFDRRNLAASAGAQVTLTFVNEDAAGLHNFALYTNSRATEKIFGSDAKAGPLTEDVRFTAPSSPGTYFFRCDAHPDTMTGSFAVR
jgi:plastocyanin